MHEIVLRSIAFYCAENCSWVRARACVRANKKKVRYALAFVLLYAGTVIAEEPIVILR